MNDGLTRNIEFSVEAGSFAVFQDFFSYGFKINAQIGCSLFDLLCRQAGISEAYISDRVQTIFLNGKVVDDVACETVTDNAVIALSAAMPGLFGAVFRKSGVLSSMRTCNAPKDSGPVIQNHQGPVTLKFFNLIAADLGSDFLEKGITASGDYFIRFVNWKQSQLKSVCRQVTVDGEKAEIDDIVSFCRPDRDVFFSIRYV